MKQGIQPMIHAILMKAHGTDGHVEGDGKINSCGFELIKKFEGYEAVPYKCPAGVWTVGYGSIRGKNGKPLTKHSKEISEEDAEMLLSRDISSSEKTVVRLAPGSLNRNQFSACVSFVYNLGSGSFNGSTLRKMLLRGDLDEAAGQFQRWCFARGRKLPGLLRRRLAERDLFLS
tara:strand:- start:54 stop:575 length:522 start_codon:yes stop_codon:yes gene_type:complete